MKRETGIIFLLILIFIRIDAQNWTNLDYNPDQPGLEHNPLKGFATLWNPENQFPHSIQGHLFGLDDVMTGMNTFNWTKIDNAISKDAANGIFSYIQVNIDPANGETHMPDFLKDQVDWEVHPDDLVPDWNNEVLMQAMLNFIEAFGGKYDDDPSVFLVHFGLYGMWGEWHVGEYKTFEMTSANQHRLSAAYIKAFPDKQLLARYPGTLPDNEIVGYSDGLFFGQSIDAENPWYFHNKLKFAYADQNWKLHPIGGEIDPGLQSEIWKTWPNSVGQDVTMCLDSIHPSWLFSHHVLTMDSSANETQWSNALRCQKMLGYTLFIYKYRLTASEGKAYVELGIQNKGIAPMYADWDVEIGVLDSTNQFKSLGKENWKVSHFLPGNKDYFRAFTATNLVNDGTYKVVLRIVNPLEEISTKAKPVRFANTSQDLDQKGWITLGEMSISGGVCGEAPIRVAGISMSDETNTMKVGESMHLSVVVHPDNASRKDITWVSDHPATASVDSNGLVLAGPLMGQATISAYSQDGGFEAKTTVNVDPLWFQIPGKIEAEEFTNQSGVQTENCSDVGRGLNVGWIDDGDWMEYPVHNSSDSTYFSAIFRLSSPNNGGLLAVYLDEEPIGEIAVPNTGSWQSWRHVSGNLKIGKGKHFLKMHASSGGFNVNYVDFTFGAPTDINHFLIHKLSIYPMPASNHISINSGDFEFNKIKITDLSGQTVFDKDIDYLSNIDLSIDINPGVYILQLFGKDHFTSKKIIIMKE